jgi:hypothetical protein
LEPEFVFEAELDSEAELILELEDELLHVGSTAQTPTTHTEHGAEQGTSKPHGQL